MKDWFPPTVHEVENSLAENTLTSKKNNSNLVKGLDEYFLFHFET